MKMIFAFFIGISSLNAANAQNNTVVSAKNQRSFPSYTLLTLDSQQVNSIALRDKSNPTVVVYFSPLCHHCKEFTEKLTSQLRDFIGVKFLMVSAYPLADIRQFQADQGLKKMPAFTMAFDPDFKMGQFFELKEIPGVFAYNKEGMLVKSYQGKVDMDELKAAVAR